MGKKFWTVCMFLGLALLAGALLLTIHNLREQEEGGELSGAVLDQIGTQIEEVRRQTLQSTFQPSAPDETVAEIGQADAPAGEKKQTLSVDGRDYTGVISFPSLGLELPVQKDWSYSNLRVSPCVYYGAPDEGSFVICGHNYRTHFGSIGRLSPGDRVTFMDVEGEIYTYEVSALEVLSPQSVRDVISDGWDLTLFTCTLGGRTRMVVRCDRI